MKTRENRFSIRKLSVGASSVVVATLLFMGGSSAQAAEKQQEVGMRFITMTSIPKYRCSNYYTCNKRFTKF